MMSKQPKTEVIGTIPKLLPVARGHQAPQHRGGAHEDKRTKRNRTRGARNRRALQEQASPPGTERMTNRPLMTIYLSEEEQAFLKRLAGTDFAVKQLGDEWEDDHIPCVAVRFIRDGFSVDTSLWWCGARIVGAVSYADQSTRAKSDVLAEALRSFD
jgi:hypothetical protein